MNGVYAGSFDPVTHGHVWVISKAAEVVGPNGQLIIALAKNADKKSYFTFEERVELIEQVLASTLPVNLFNRCAFAEAGNEYLLKFAERQSANFIFRGIRNVKDFDYEVGIQQVNRDLCPNIETIFFLPPAEMAGISSSIVRGMVGFDGWQRAVAKYVHPIVVQALEKKVCKDSNS